MKLINMIRHTISEIPYTKNEHNFDSNQRFKYEHTDLIDNPNETLVKHL